MHFNIFINLNEMRVIKNYDIKSSCTELEVTIKTGFVFRVKDVVNNNNAIAGCGVSGVVAHHSMAAKSLGLFSFVGCCCKFN